MGTKGTESTQRNTSSIMFFSNSKHTYPGTGASEYLTDADREGGVFDALYEMRDFRQKMSNFYPIEDGFVCAGRHWRTVEHCFQGRKFEEVAPEYGVLFALESGSELSQADGGAARKAGGRKAHPLTDEQRKRWEERKWDVMAEALHAKYSQNDELRAILLATHDAELLHRPPRSKLVREVALMELRELLRQEL
jgi:ribA/ribD-fused uncharacterized protein